VEHQQRCILSVSDSNQHTSSAYVSIRQHTSAGFSIRQHTSAYVSIRQHTSAHVSTRQHTSAYVCMRQRTSAYVSIRQHTSAHGSIRQHKGEYISICQHTSAYVSIRHRTSAYVSICASAQHMYTTSAYVHQLSIWFHNTCSRECTSAQHMGLEGSIILCQQICSIASMHELGVFSISEPCFIFLFQRSRS
jgi:hypothetical protein